MSRRRRRRGVTIIYPVRQLINCIFSDDSTKAPLSTAATMGQPHRRPSSSSCIHNNTALCGLHCLA